MMHNPITRQSILAAMGVVMKRARAQRGLTQELLAEKLSLTTEFVARIERGRAMPSLENFTLIVDVLEVSADDLLGLTNAPPVVTNDPLAGVPARLADLTRRVMRLDKPGRTAVHAVLRAMERDGEPETQAAADPPRGQPRDE